jgi:uncharacterized protein
MEPAAMRDAPPVRLVLDTNAWLDLLHFEDPRCARLLRALESGRALALVDTPCAAEWRRVLAYQALGLDTIRRGELLRRFDALARPLDRPCRPQPWPALPRCRDREDQIFLTLACAADAAWLLSRDAELLALDRRCARRGLFRIVPPEAFTAG